MLKNEGDAKNKSYGSKSKKGDMKRSNSKKSPNASNQEFNSALYNKFGHPNGIGLYGPGKIKLNKEKPSSSSRGSARWNKSPSNPKVNGSSKINGVDDMKPSKDSENSFAFNKAAVNNYMNNSQSKTDSTPNNENEDDSTQNIDNNKRKKSNSKLNTFGNQKNSVLKELLQLKQENNKLFKAYGQDHNDLIDNEGIQPAEYSLK